ncbi:MAG TPA: hypothetical protein VD948_06745 [Rhodothermales bacterium]|nr:hypothetical protein [Rhodothermales bacterium]
MVRPPEPPRPYVLALRDAQASGRIEAIFRQAFDPTPGGAYQPWDELRRRTPPEGLTHEEWWVGVKVARQPLLRGLPLRDLRGRPFRSRPRTGLRHRDPGTVPGQRLLP